MSSKLPFKKVSPLAFIGLNQEAPFAAGLTEGRVMYASGSHILVENTRNNQQKIVFSKRLNCCFTHIHHQLTFKKQHVLAVTVLDMTTLMPALYIVGLDEEAGIEGATERWAEHTLKHIEEFEKIEQIQFFDEGNLIAIKSSYEHYDNLTVYRTMGGDMVHQETFSNCKIKVRSTVLNKIQCLGVMERDQKDHCKFSIRVTMDLNRKYSYDFGLEPEEHALQYHLETEQSTILAIVLTSKGYIHIYRINEFDMELITKCDVAVPTQHTVPKVTSSLSSLSDATEEIQIGHNLQPKSIELANKKVIVTFSRSKVIGVLFYSAFNPQNTKFTLISDVFNKYEQASEIQSLKISSNDCSLVALLHVDRSHQPKGSEMEVKVSLLPTVKTIMREEEEQEQGNLSILPQTSHAQDPFLVDQSQTTAYKSHYVVLQVDLLSNMVEHEDHQQSPLETYSLLVGHGRVSKVVHCSYTNTIFVLFDNQLLKCYDLSPQEGPKGKASIGRFVPRGMLLWEQTLKYQPYSLACHPFACTILLIYPQFIRFHYYSNKGLYCSFLVTTIKNCKLAAYSPLGDKLILSTTGGIVIANSYTYEIEKTIHMPNLHLNSCSLEPALSFGASSKGSAINSKTVSHIIFDSNDDLMIFWGNKALSMLIEQRLVHFGLVENSLHDHVVEVVYDRINSLVLMVMEELILVLSKCSINSNGRCEVISKMEISARSVCLCAEIGVLLIGGANGVLYMLRWPDYSQEQLYLSSTNQFHLFDEPIVSLKATSNLKYLYAFSATGAMCICQLDSQISQIGISKEVRDKMLARSEKPIKMHQRWFNSCALEDKRERQIIKLRGEEADLSNNHGLYEQEQADDEKVMAAKQHLIVQNERELREFEERIGLRPMLQKLAMVKDEFHTLHKKRQRVMEGMHMEQREKYDEMFRVRTQLEQQANRATLDCLEEREKTLKFYNSEKSELEETYSRFIEEMTGNQQETLQEQEEHQIEMRFHSQVIEVEAVEEMAKFNQDYADEMGDLNKKINNINSKNREVKVSIANLYNKMSDISIEKEGLAIDLQKIEEERLRHEQVKKSLVQRNQITKEKYDKLAKQNKELSQSIRNCQRIREAFEERIAQLRGDINRCKTSLSFLQDQKYKVSDHILQQRSIARDNETVSADLNSRIAELKDTRREKLYASGLSHTTYWQELKTLMRQLSIDSEKTVAEICKKLDDLPSERKRNSIEGFNFDKMRRANEKLMEHTEKWEEVKESYTNSFNRTNNRLLNERTKLTHRYNDLVKDCQDNQNRIKHLKKQIEEARHTPAPVSRHIRKNYGSIHSVKHCQTPSLGRLRSDHSIKQSSTLMSDLKDRVSFLRKENVESKKFFKRKGICISVHRDAKWITEA